MRVLLITTDLYRTVGGGQTVYRKIVESAPDVRFCYFRENEAADAPRPRNATAIPLAVGLKLRVLSPPPFPAYRRYQLEEADRYARSVAGQQFDIVDMPDYYSFGSLLPDAFAHHHVTVKRIVLAMHGNISVSLEMAWGSVGDNVLEQQMLERDQFASADGAYAISRRYMREWQAIISRPVHYMDPIGFVDIAGGRSDDRDSRGLKPSLYCIGRSERRKGNDLFVELVRWLDPDSYEKAAHIGDEVATSSGAGSRYTVQDIARKRDLKIDYLPSFGRKELSGLFAGRSIVILPVRYDTLNLIALEALFEGCPVAVSSEAGVCDYLDETYPGLPYVKIDFSNFYSAVSSINNLIARYDEHRTRLQEHVTGALRVKEVPDMRSIYERILTDASTAVSVSRKPIAYLESGSLLLARFWRTTRRLLPTEAYRAAKRLLGRPWAFFKRNLGSGYLGNLKFLGVIADAMHVPSRLGRISAHSEYSKLRLREKLNEIYGTCTNPLYRCNFWLDIARIERVLGNDLVAVAYELRALRLVGRDVFGILGQVVKTLETRNLVVEAEAATVMYGDPGNAAERVHAFLKDRYRQNLSKAAVPFERVDDRRAGVPKVAVIVSLYNAAPKLKVFLTTLLQQTLARQGQVEFIFIDSASPDGEQQLLSQFWAGTPMNAVCARSARRETIQAAWNRGIHLARAPYLVFLGVDEALYPEALEVLAGELDRNAATDWVMANSLVTEVDDRGIFRRDVMPYDRSGATKDHAYLETCYLSWVGGMYRRTMHDRFGYYDETFAAAGDTEFKNRILPRINVRFVPRTLGLFLNYPDERTTASPRAEIEDLRAWYIHRTPGGVRYAFDERLREDVERLLCAALGYRKSYCAHLSSDIEYAAYLASYLGLRSRVAGHLAQDMELLLRMFRSIEFVTRSPSCAGCVGALAMVWRKAMELQKRHENILRGQASPTYRVLNDNRYEQHSWLWKT